MSEKGDHERKSTSFRRTKDQRMRDLAFCSDLFLKGYTYREILVKLNKRNEREGFGYTITLRALYLDIQKMLVEWKRDRLENIDDYITQELRKLDLIEHELWEAWNKSKSIKMRVKKGRNHKSYEIVEESLCGNPRYLELLLTVQQRRAKLLGLDAPVKVDAVHRIDTDRPQYDINSLPKDLLYSVADKLQEQEYLRIQAAKDGEDSK